MSPELATSPTEGQVPNPDPGGKPAVRQTAERKDRMGPPTLCGTNVSLYRIHFRRYWTGVW